MTRTKAAQEPAEVRVAPAGNWQLHHDGQVVEPGQTITVPAELADRWQSARLAEPA